MKLKLKWIAAAAIAATGGAAHAQSSVTLYGVVDAGLMYQSTSAASFNPASKNLGKLYRFKDAGHLFEQLGHDRHRRHRRRLSRELQAARHLRHRHRQGRPHRYPGRRAENSTRSRAWACPGRSARSTAGRQIAPIAIAMGETDVRGGRWFGSILTSWLGMNQAAGWAGTSTNGPLGALYDSNAIVYESPSFAGVKGLLEYSPGGVAGSFQGNTRESAVLKYSNYGLRLSAALLQRPRHQSRTEHGADGPRQQPALSILARSTRSHDFSVSASYSEWQESGAFESGQHRHVHLRPRLSRSRPRSR